MKNLPKGWKIAAIAAIVLAVLAVASVIVAICI